MFHSPGLCFIRRVSALVTQLCRFARRSIRRTQSACAPSTPTHPCTSTHQTRMGTPTWTFSALKPIVYERAPLIQQYSPLRSHDEIPPLLNRRTGFYAILVAACVLFITTAVFVATDPFTVQTVHQRARSSIANRLNWRSVRANRTNTSVFAMTAQPNVAPPSSNTTVPRNASH